MNNGKAKGTPRKKKKPALLQKAPHPQPPWGKESRSRIILFNNFLTEEYGTALFDHLKQLKPKERKMFTSYGRKVAQPRYSQVFGDISYTYCGKDFATIPVTDELEALQKRVNLLYGDSIWSGCFNSILVNWYMDGQDYIGHHRDNEPQLVKGSPVVGITLGLGSSRKLIIKRYDPKKIGDTLYVVQLKANSLYAMEGSMMQQKYTHGIPKKTTSQPRISITFRCFKKITPR